MMAIIIVSDMKEESSPLEFAHKHWPKVQVLLGVVLIIVVMTGAGR